MGARLLRGDRAAVRRGWVRQLHGWDDQDRIKANYRGNYDRLVEVKRTYDPGNLFHVNQNIKP